jgi:hypothetical protein
MGQSKIDWHPADPTGRTAARASIEGRTIWPVDGGIGPFLYGKNPAVKLARLHQDRNADLDWVPGGGPFFVEITVYRDTSQLEFGPKGAPASVNQPLVARLFM